MARTKVLFHLVSAESEDPVRDYKVVRQELESYSPELANKKEFVFLSKSDLTAVPVPKKGKKGKRDMMPISVYDETSLKPIKKILDKIIADKKI